MTPEEANILEDKAAGYYLGLWNILIKDNTPAPIIINCAINNTMAVLDRYMAHDKKIDLLEAMLESAKKEAQLAVDTAQ